jgi:cobalt-zinc-cadmium efflux system outer membrane protein
MPPIRWLSALGAMAAFASSAHAEPLTFSQALDLAAAHAPSLRASTLQVDAARAASRAAGALPDPKLSVGVDNFPISGPVAGRFGSDEMTMARVGISQDMPNAARRRAQVAGADAQIGVAEAQARIEARKVRLATALAWIDLAYAQRRLAALDQLVGGLKGLWEGQPASIASGSARPASALGPVQMRARFEDMRSELVANVAKSRAELSRWTADPAPSTVGAPAVFDVDETALRAGLDRTPALAAFQPAQRQAEAEIASARAAKRSDWSWEASYGRRDPMFGDMVSAGVSVSLPLFSNTRQEPLIAAREIDANRVRAEREDARRALAAALEADLADHLMHHEQWGRATAVLVPAAEQRAHLETSSYAAGRADFADLMDALTGLADAKLTALEREAMVARDGARIVLTYGSDDQ